MGPHCGAPSSSYLYDFAGEFSVDRLCHTVYCIQERNRKRALVPWSGLGYEKIGHSLWWMSSHSLNEESTSSAHRIGQKHTGQLTLSTAWGTFTMSRQRHDSETISAKPCPPIFSFLEATVGVSHTGHLLQSYVEMAQVIKCPANTALARQFCSQSHKLCASSTNSVAVWVKPTKLAGQNVLMIKS